MNKEGLSIKVVSRKNCTRCETIQMVAEADKVPVQVIYFHEGGAELLARYDFLPYLMPAVMAFRDGSLVRKWNGLSEFLEDWT